MRSRAALVSLLLASTAWPCVVIAQDSLGDATPPRLKIAPMLEPLPPKAVRPAAPVPSGEAIFLRADRLEGLGEKWVEATGKVELRSRRQTVLADWLRYDADSDEVWAKGNVTIRRGIDWITGPEAKFKRDAETGFFSSPQFHIGENASRGDAKQIVFEGPNQYKINEGRYTTCVAGNDDWYLTSRDVDLDRSRLIGTAHNASVYFKGVPILYTPWLQFPLSNERKSGFLTPLFGSTNSRGVEMSLPYYFNLAPNYDATVTPRVMTRRGLQLNGQFRYLFRDMAGETDAEVLPNDRVAGFTRYGLSWKHNENFGFLPGLAGYLNLQKVSDDTYFADLSDRLAITSQTILPREGGFAYSHEPWGVLARIQTFQTLQDPNNPITPPYFREPQLQGTLNPIEWHGVDFAGSGEYVRFHQPALLGAERSVIYPTAAWSRRGSAWFFTAKTGLNASYYKLEQPVLGEANLHRVLPISSLDGGLIFERDANFFGNDFVQTLEPRAYYVYIPFRDQSKIPAFDSAIDDFNFSQLFTENRYLGNDRIGDANQLTLAVTSRLLTPETGEERMRFAIGQRYYFSTQRVTLNEAPRTAKDSDLLLAAEGRLSRTWSAAAALEYNVTHPQTERLDIGVRWQPGIAQVLNASYRFIRSDVDPTNTELKQFDLSGQWPFGNNWSVIARWNYSLVDRKTLEGIVGVEYNGGCWAIRVVGQRLTTTTQQASTSVFVQFELTGLARLGTNPIDVLKRSVPGYQTSNEPSGQSNLTNPADYFPEF